MRLYENSKISFILGEFDLESLKRLKVSIVADYLNVRRREDRRLKTKYESYKQLAWKS